jgi:hypothetical protein
VKVAFGKGGIMGNGVWALGRDILTLLAGVSWDLLRLRSEWSQIARAAIYAESSVLILLPLP